MGKVGDIVKVRMGGMENEALIVRTGMHPASGKRFPVTPDLEFDEFGFSPNEQAEIERDRKHGRETWSLFLSLFLDTFPWVDPKSGFETSLPTDLSLLLIKSQIGPSHVIEMRFPLAASSGTQIDLISPEGKICSERVGTEEADIMGTVWILSQAFKKILESDPSLQFQPLQAKEDWGFKDHVRDKILELASGSRFWSLPGTSSFFVPKGEGLVIDPSDMQVIPDEFSGWFHPVLEPSQMEGFKREGIFFPVPGLTPTSETPKD